MFHIGINMMRLKSSFVVLLFGFVSYSSLGFTQPEQSKVSESTVIQSLQSANLMPIPIGSLSTQDNARHQAYCKSIGANDVTNSGKVMVSSGISDLAVCLRNHHFSTVCDIVCTNAFAIGLMSGIILRSLFSFFFNDTATTEIYTLSLHDALPIFKRNNRLSFAWRSRAAQLWLIALCEDRKSTRLNSSHQIISYAVFCLKKKK